MVTFVGIRSPPRTLPALPRRRTLCPSLVSLSCFFFFFQLLRGRQCLFEIRSLLHRHSIRTYLVRTKPPITFVMVIFLWCQMVCMIFVRQIIHLSTKIVGSTNFNLSIAELFILYKSVMDTLEIPLLAGWRRSIPCFLASSRNGAREVALSLCRVRNGKEVHRVLHEFLIFVTSFMQEMSARAVDYANVPV